MDAKGVKAELAAVVDSFVASVATLDDCEQYKGLRAATQHSVKMAMDSFLGAQAKHIQESREVLFVRKYGQPSELVRKQYVKLLEGNSRNDGHQHRVSVAGYNARGAHHWGLKPEAYSFCKPDERILAAFAVTEEWCAIEEKPHFEHWGN